MRLKKSVEVWVLSPDDQVLLLWVPSADAPFWQPVTGGVEGDESNRAAAVRELFEETGLTVDPMELSLVDPRVEVRIDDTLTIEKALFYVLHHRVAIRLNPREHSRFAWVHREEVFDRLSWPSNRATWMLVRQSVQSW